MQSLKQKSIAAEANNGLRAMDRVSSISLDETLAACLR